MLARIDTSQLRLSVDLAAIVSQDVKLTLSNGYYWGPCPFCNEGHDRFKVFPNKQGDAFYCRQCLRKGDAIEYVVQRHGLAFVDAVKWLQSNDTFLQKADPLLPQQQKEPELTEGQLNEWREKASKLATRAAKSLLYVESEAAYQARIWLQNRGIEQNEIERYMLGFNDHWRTILPGHKLPPGITIPRFNEHYELIAVNVYLDKPSRDFTGGKKRMFAKGSTAKSFFNGQAIPQARRVIITEGEFDAMLLSRFTAPLAKDIAVITAGGSQTIPDDLSILAGKSVVLILDNDQAGKAGRERWLNVLPGAAVAIVPNGVKDITDFYKAGGDFPAWLKEIMALWQKPDRPLQETLF